MTKPYDIIIVPDPVLKQAARPVETVDPDVMTQVRRMKETLKHASGVGLAANQVNLLRRIILVDITEGSWRSDPSAKANVIALINPEIVQASEEKSEFLEGCLSIPDQFANVKRPRHVTVQYLDEEGKEREITGSDYLSHILQHEIDHLDGKLFIDHLSSLKRNMLLKKYTKEQKFQAL